MTISKHHIKNPEMWLIYDMIKKANGEITTNELINIVKDKEMIRRNIAYLHYFGLIKRYKSFGINNEIVYRYITTQTILSSGVKL